MPAQEATPAWRRSTRSHNEDIGCCVEVADLGANLVGVRDSKNPGGPHLTMSVGGLACLIAAIKGDLLGLTGT